MWPGCCEDTEEMEPIKGYVLLMIVEVWALHGPASRGYGLP